MTSPPPDEVNAAEVNAAEVNDEGPGDAALAWTLLDTTTESAATRVYLALLRTPYPTRELLLAQGVPRALLDPALEVLHSRGLVQLGEDGDLDVPPPMSAIPQHAVDLERRAAQVRASAHELSRLYYAARAAPRAPDAGVMVLHDLEEVAAQSSVLIAGARDEVVVARAMTARTLQLMAAPMESQREPTVGRGARSVRHRTVWDTAILQLPGAIEVLRARQVGAEEQRYLARVPLTLVVVDTSGCLVEWSQPSGAAPTTDEQAPVGVLIQSPGFVAGARSLLDRMWELATPLNRGVAAQDVDPRDLTVLRLLAAGVADAVIARQVGVSQRTVERRIRALLERLGADTRFQAGVQAVRRGWL